VAVQLVKEDFTYQQRIRSTTTNYLLQASTRYRYTHEPRLTEHILTINMLFIFFFWIKLLLKLHDFPTVVLKTEGWSGTGASTLPRVSTMPDLEAKASLI
jgi:hypothetical protein